MNFTNKILLLIAALFIGCEESTSSDTNQEEFSSTLENSDLEVIVYNSKIAGINLINSHNENRNEIYEFVKNFISDPGSEAKNNSWTGYKNLSIGDLIITYGKTEIANEIIEYLEITNAEMFDFTLGERVMNATG